MYRKSVAFFLAYLMCSYVLLVSPSLVAENSDVRSKLEGTWNSPEWKYGFRIEGSNGYMTSWHNTYNPEDPTKKGDVVLKITEFTDDGFKGIHTFYDSSQINVVARIVDSNTLELSGRREVWKMYRENE